MTRVIWLYTKNLKNSQSPIFNKLNVKDEIEKKKSNIQNKKKAIVSQKHSLVHPGQPVKPTGQVIKAE